MGHCTAVPFDVAPLVVESLICPPQGQPYTFLQEFKELQRLCSADLS